MAIEFRTQLQIFQSLRSFITAQAANKITDFNVGSVVNSTLYTFSNSLASLYATARNLYDAIYVSTATGTDLDKKVADFTLTRKQASKASTVLTFFRTSPSTSDYIIPAGVRVLTRTVGTTIPITYITIQDATLYSSISNESHTFVTGDNFYNFNNRLVSSIVSISGTFGSTAGYEFVQNVDYRLSQVTVSQHGVEWLLTGNSPDNGTNFFVTYRNLSVDIQAESYEAGDFNNVNALTLTVLPNAPGGTDGVINYVAGTGGLNTETDEELRARVPLFLSSLARGTRGAIRGAALNVTGVKSVTVIEPDYPNGTVSLIIDDGSGTASTQLLRDVKDAIDGTLDGVENSNKDGYKSAGIVVNVTTPSVRSINISASVYAKVGSNINSIQASIVSNIENYLLSLGAGEKIVRSQVIEEIMTVTGVLDMNLSTLTIDGTTSGNVSIGLTEVGRAGLLTITVTTI